MTTRDRRVWPLRPPRAPPTTSDGIDHATTLAGAYDSADHDADATLRSGASWTTPEGYTLRVGSVQPSGAKVFVSGGPVCPDARREPDNGAAEAVAVGVPSMTSHAFCAVGDEDWVQFEATAGTRYRLKTVHLSEGTDTGLELYAPDGVTPLAKNDDYHRGSLASRIRFTPATSGTYYLAADHVLDRAGIDLTYKLKLVAR